MSTNKSWGNNPKVKDQKNINYSKELLFDDLSYLPIGLGRSYGDVGLNENGTTISMTNHNEIISLDEKNGILNCESGLSIKDILSLIVPKGWFLPVVPGTRNVTIGGAIANDIHGKNHHKVGTFGNYVKSIRLLRSDGTILNCNDEENRDYLSATVGGLGLTGIIISAEVYLKKISSTYVDVTTFKFQSLDEYWEINNKFEKEFDYTVSWVDCIYNQNKSLRGVYLAGNHKENFERKKYFENINITFPFTPPFSLINNFSLKILNQLYYSLNKTSKNSVQHYKKFFFPLDVVNNWNKAYGKKGFFQYQFVVPKKNGRQAIQKVLEVINRNNQIPALGVLKNFGDIKSTGLNSFPFEGVTLSLDFPNKGDKTKKLFEELNKVIFENNGRIYPAKDAFMNPKEFEDSYEGLNNFIKYIDPKFSSSFWRRVNK